ncbi:MAG: hypothetical protein MJK04_13135, partial [Psychrosphaera sp.]|nr:hypothetical protein [Psychrosphaera sp.]
HRSFTILDSSALAVDTLASNFARSKAQFHRHFTTDFNQLSGRIGQSRWQRFSFSLDTGGCNHQSRG